MWVFEYHYYYFNRAYDHTFEGIAFFKKYIADSLKYLFTIYSWHNTISL